jgi:hypothetical protein
LSGQETQPTFVKLTVEKYFLSLGLIIQKRSPPACGSFTRRKQGCREDIDTFMSDSGNVHTKCSHVDPNMCFKKSFTTLKAYINYSRGHAQCFELS